jgi:hypothetical protein
MFLRNGGVFLEVHGSPILAFKLGLYVCSFYAGDCNLLLVS